MTVIDTLFEFLNETHVRENSLNAPLSLNQPINHWMKCLKQASYFRSGALPMTCVICLLKKQAWHFFPPFKCKLRDSVVVVRAVNYTLDVSHRR